MRDLYQTLQQKEMDIVRVRKEIEALHSVIPLLDDDLDQARNATGSVLDCQLPQEKRRSLLASWPLKLFAR